MAKSEVTPWEFLDAETNAKFQFRQNTSGENLLDTYTIRFESDNTDKNGKSLGTVNKTFFKETRAMLHILFEYASYEGEFIYKATKIFSKKMRFITMRIPEELESEIKERILEFKGDDF